MSEQSKEGYIYIFKCIVGSHSDICKIGKTKHFGDSNDRIRQHGRTTYYGFTPYTDFASGNPIATAFKVKDMDKADRLVKNCFRHCQVSTIEIYNLDYDVAIEKIYRYLTIEQQFIELIKDGISVYNFLDEVDVERETTKAAFEEVKQEILAKYDQLPEELLVLLRDKNEFEEHCVSHFSSGNYIDFPNDLVLDIHFNKSKRREILAKLKGLL